MFSFISRDTQICKMKAGNKKIIRVYTNKQLANETCKIARASLARTDEADLSNG
jgi:hypothetical protein